MSNNFRYQIYR